LGKGVLISPSVVGNVMHGPTAENLSDKAATETTAEGIDFLLDKGRRILPDLLDEEVTAMYSGLRASTEHDDYQIHQHGRYLCIGGIRSTGLSASLAIAEWVGGMLAEAGMQLTRKPSFKTITMPNLGEAFPRPYQRAELIQANPDYGRIVCHCERVTRGEIADAMRSVIPARSADGLRRRTRAQMGRCQGFFCTAEISAMLGRAP
jgi:glycerol-3-phosphate dehydrogenase